MTVLARRAFDHRADLLAALVYGCLAYLSFNALADYANAHHLFPQPQGGWAFAVAVDGTVLYAFISFKRAPWLAGILLVSGAAATYTLQRWHAQGAHHPLWVAGVVPGAMVLVTFAWHAIRQSEPLQPDVETRPRVAQVGTDRTRPATLGRPEPDQPRTSPRTKVRTTNGSSFTADQRQRIADLVAREASGREIQRALGVSDRAYREKVLPLVRSLKGELVPGGDR